jgi:hypothetical protein
MLKVRSSSRRSHRGEEKESLEKHQKQEGRMSRVSSGFGRETVRNFDSLIEKGRVDVTFKKVKVKVAGGGERY